MLSSSTSVLQHPSTTDVSGDDLDLSVMLSVMRRLLLKSFKLKLILSRDSKTKSNSWLSASSGILLGVVTLPTVMVSKLIELPRRFALENIRFKGCACAFGHP